MSEQIKARLDVVERYGPNESAIVWLIKSRAKVNEYFEQERGEE